MKRLLVAAALAVAAVAGCGDDSGPSAEDQAFDEQMTQQIAEETDCGELDC